MDFGFKTVYTPTILRFIYGLAPLGLTGLWAVLTGLGFWWNIWAGLAALFIVGPALMIGGLLVLRVVCELLILAVRAADDVHAIRTAHTGSDS